MGEHFHLWGALPPVREHSHLWRSTLTYGGAFLPVGSTLTCREHSHLWGSIPICGGALSPVGEHAHLWGNTLTCGGALSPVGSTSTCGKQYLWGSILTCRGVFPLVGEHCQLWRNTSTCREYSYLWRALLPEGSTPLTGKLLYLLQGGHIPPPHMSTSFMPPVRCSLAIRMMGAASVPPEPHL